MHWWLLLIMGWAWVCFRREDIKAKEIRALREAVTALEGVLEDRRPIQRTMVYFMPPTMKVKVKTAAKAQAVRPDPVMGLLGISDN